MGLIDGLLRTVLGQAIRCADVQGDIKNAKALRSIFEKAGEKRDWSIDTDGSWLGTGTGRTFEEEISEKGYANTMKRLEKKFTDLTGGKSFADVCDFELPCPDPNP